MTFAAPIAESVPRECGEAGPSPLHAERLVFETGGVRLIDIAALHLRAGGPTILMGPNGAGKSLLLRLLHGLIPATRGRVSTPAGSDRSGAPRQAMVFQHPVLLRRSVAANIDYALKACGVARADRPARTQSLLAEAELAGKARQPARTLSGGEAQRLALVRALATDPALLFLDEPTSSLDPASTAAIEALIRRAAEAGTKAVLVTHDVGQARRLGAEIVFLHRGQVAEQTPAATFFRAPRSAPARAFLAGELLV